MLHEINIKQEKNSTCTHMTIDGKPIQCCGYDISQVAGELPKIEIDLLGSLDLRYFTDKIAIPYLDSLIEIMDVEMFKEFCEKWKEKHCRIEKCMTCKFHQYEKLTQGHICCNPDSEYVAEYTEANDWCDQHEFAENNTNSGNGI